MRGLLLELINAQGYCILDGGLGTELAKTGLLDQELWSGAAVLPHRTETGLLDLGSRNVAQVSANCSTQTK